MGEAQPAAPASPPVATGQARYFDAVLAEMDRFIRPELSSDKSVFVYETLRRIFSRQAVQMADMPGPGELGEAARARGAEVQVGPDLRLAALREAAELDRIEAAVDARLARVAAPVAADQTMDAQSVQRYLQGLDHSGVAVQAFRVLAGGRSKQTILLQATGLRDLPADLVIRRDLHAGATGTTVVDEFRLLQALADRHAPVPRPYVLEASGRLAFMLMQRVPGALRGDIMTAPGSAQAVLESARALGQLHALTVAELEPALAAHGRAGPGETLAARVAALRADWNERARDDSATVALACAWMEAHADSVVPAASLVHGDYSFHNLLYDGDRLSAVLDWELAHIGHPAEDLGYIQTVAMSVVGWDRYMAVYRQAGGQNHDPVTVGFYALFGTLKLMVLIQRARAMFESGVTDDVQLAEVALYHLPKLVQKLSIELRRVLALPA
jgi:aminoglycoside phosphotransferase (APT) family kinase protein